MSYYSSLLLRQTADQGIDKERSQMAHYRPCHSPKPLTRLITLAKKQSQRGAARRDSRQAFAAMQEKPSPELPKGSIANSANPRRWRVRELQLAFRARLLDTRISEASPAISPAALHP